MTLRQAFFSTLVFCVASLTAAPAQTLQLLSSFKTDGWPETNLVQGFNGDLYGTTAGAVFKITTAGTRTTLYTFCSKSECPDGKTPSALMLASNLNFYGTTAAGGAYGHGTVFKITSEGELTTLYSFCAKSGCPDGQNPLATLVQGTDGNLYGTTSGGGAIGNYGTVFKITLGGKLTTVYSFCVLSDCYDGWEPEGALIQGSSGNFYGTTYEASDRGNVFEMTPAGVVTSLYNFCSETYCDDGDLPVAGVVQAANGDLYGTATGGGAYGNNGTVFEITSANVFTALYSFCLFNCANPEDSPRGGLVLATDGNFYGTVTYDGAIYKITPSGSFTWLYTFGSGAGGCCPDGEYVYAGLMQHTNGSFYGTANGGGTYNEGTVFSFSNGLGPFVTPVPAYGNVGATFYILGTNLTGTTVVTVNGVSAKFTVESSSEIKATVPAGATTGTISVTTRTTTLNSNLVFQVLQ
jgi:uncharacterized repeat protein (TIGR03803 family)